MFSRKTVAAPIPCASCHATELKILREQFDASSEEFWVYDRVFPNQCTRCDPQGLVEALWKTNPICGGCCSDNPYVRVQVPLPIETVGLVERAVESSRVATGGSDFRAHGTFVSHLALLDVPERVKQSLIRWAPSVMIAYEQAEPGCSRKLRRGRRPVVDEAPQAAQPCSNALMVGASPGPSVPEQSLLQKLSNCCPGPRALYMAKKAQVETNVLLQQMATKPANDDCIDGAMLGTQVEADAYGEETRVKGVSTPNMSKVLGRQIGPSLIETEVMESCVSNMKAGLAKRVQPLPFKAKNDKKFVRKIEKTVGALIEHVFSPKKIKQWREANPDFDEFKSKKWSGDRWRNAIEEALADVSGRIEQTFQIKENEALPAKGKAPRPIIQCGDRAQVMMKFPVRCFEELLFEHFEEASIKHLPKHDAMKRVAQHLRQDKNAFVIEGDGSAWDSCCNPTIRNLTENRIIRHIIEVLGTDAEVPKLWLKKMLEDMEKPKLKGKAKVSDHQMTPIRVMIDSIRQSGHAGTSCFNYLINLVCWLVVVCDEPWTMIPKDHKGNLRSGYRSAFTNEWHILRYAFEGDDSALSTTEDLSKFEEHIESLWTSMGFRMKLVYVKDKLTFTGFDHLCDNHGPVGVFVPEIARNVASASWSCSSELKSHPERVHSVGAAAMLARAENFKDCGPFCRYFASLGLAHAKHADRGIGEAEAMQLGIAPVASVRDALQDLYDSAEPMSGQMRTLVRKVVPFSSEQECELLNVHFDDPFDYMLARKVIPFTVWDPKKFAIARR